jgi:hypothetical protein
MTQSITAFPITASQITDLPAASGVGGKIGTDAFVLQKASGAYYQMPLQDLALQSPTYNILSALNFKAFQNVANVMTPMSFTENWLAVSRPGSDAEAQVDSVVLQDRPLINTVTFLAHLYPTSAVHVAITLTVWTDHTHTTVQHIYTQSFDIPSGSPQNASMPVTLLEPIFIRQSWRANVKQTGGVDRFDFLAVYVS